MPLSSEEIFYADDKSVMSVETLSAARATSVGNKVEQLLLQSGNTVASDFERDEMFPEPKQGDVVWRSDLAVEQRYFELYSSVNLQGRTPAGWYAVKNNFVPIISNGTFSGSVNLPNVFNLAFTNYLVLGEVNLPSATSNVVARFSSNGTSETANLYIRTRLSGDNNATTSGTSGNGNFMSVTNNVGTLAPNRQCFQLTISNPMQAQYSRLTSDFGAIQQTTNASVGAFSNILLNTNSYDGLTIFNTPVASMQGVVSVYGYN
jgi:hypothetical protein